MDLQNRTETFNQGQLDWLHRIDGVLENSIGYTIVTDDLVESIHYPDGFIKPGTLIAKYTSGANDGKFGPFTSDATDGRQTCVGIHIDDGRMTKDQAGAVASAVTGSYVPAGWPIMVLLAKMPGSVEDDGTTAHPIVAGDLPTGALSF